MRKHASALGRGKRCLISKIKIQSWNPPVVEGKAKKKQAVLILPNSICPYVFV